MYFKCETFDKNGKIVDLRHVQVSVGGVTDASKNPQVLALKKKAQQRGCGFRVKMEDD